MRGDNVVTPHTIHAEPYGCDSQHPHHEGPGPHPAGRALDAQEAWVALRGGTQSIIAEICGTRKRFQKFLKMSLSLPCVALRHI